MASITVFPSSPILTTTNTPAPNSFTQKLIEISVKLAAGTKVNQPNVFAASGGDSITLSGFRASVRIRNSGTPSGSEAEVKVYGLPLELMNQLSTLGMVISLIPRNTLSIAVGDKVSGLSTVFSGTIIQAYGDFNGSPNVPFQFECLTGKAEDVMPATASSYPGTTDVGTIMKSIADRMGYGFENSGVNVSISSPYLPGSYGTQWKKLAKDAGIMAAEVVGSGTSGVGGLVLAIWPKNGSRNIVAPTIKPATAADPTGTMIGYPSYTQQGIIVKTLYNPQIGFGGSIVVAGSILTKANGRWIVHKLDHALDSMMPNGLWETSVYGQAVDAPNPILTPR